MTSSFACLRVSTTRQDVQGQRLAILEYARRRHVQIDEFIEATAFIAIKERIRIEGKQDIQARCINCHIDGGRSGHTRLVFVPSDDPDHVQHNLQAFADFLGEPEDGHDHGHGHEEGHEHGPERILTKIQGVSHGGLEVTDSGQVNDLLHVENRADAGMVRWP